MKLATTYLIRLTLTAFLFIVAVSQSAAQQSSNSYTPKEPRKSLLTSNDATGSLIALGPRSRESTPLQLGPVLFRPAITYRFTDANNLLRGAGNPQDTEIQNYRLSLGFEYQNLWNLEYTPTWTYYSNPAFNDRDSHSLNFSSEFQIQDWNVNFAQTYRKSNASLVETATQTPEDNWGTTISASRQLNSAWYLDLNATQDLRFTDTFSDVRNWTASSWLRHQKSPAVNSAIGYTWGYSDIDPGFNSKFHRLLLRYGFNPTDKLSVNLQGGIDAREVDAAGFGKDENPTYSGSIQYQAFDYTTIAINLSRQIGASYFSNSNRETESLTLSLSQRLLGRLNLTVSYGEVSTEYLDLLNNFVVGRDDEYDSFSVDLSTKLGNRVSVSAFYRKNENTTNVTGFGFSSDQTGISISYRR